LGDALSSFSHPYVVDWDRWLEAAPERRVALFAAIPRRWQATRPLRMRRPRAEADHGPPHMEDLLDQAGPHLGTLGDLAVTDPGRATAGQFDAHLGLWATFSQLPQDEETSCVGITRAVLLLTDGRIGPAFDSTVRTRLGMTRRLQSPEDWIEALRHVGQDILTFRGASREARIERPRAIRPASCREDLRHGARAETVADGRVDRPSLAGLTG
jgi:hypothetical protein